MAVLTHTHRGAACQNYRDYYLHICPLVRGVNAALCAPYAAYHRPRTRTTKSENDCFGATARLRVRSPTAKPGESDEWEAGRVWTEP